MCQWIPSKLIIIERYITVERYITIDLTECQKPSFVWSRRCIVWWTVHYVNLLSISRWIDDVPVSYQISINDWVLGPIICLHACRLIFFINVPSCLFSDTIKINWKFIRCGCSNWPVLYHSQRSVLCEWWTLEEIKGVHHIKENQSPNGRDIQ